MKTPRKSTDVKKETRNPASNVRKRPAKEPKEILSPNSGAFSQSVEKPDPDVIADAFRADAWNFASCLISEYRKTSPEIVEILHDQMELHLVLAFEDARTLDEHSAEVKSEGGYLSAFMHSIYCTPGFLNVLIDVAQVPSDRKSWLPAIRDEQAGKDLSASFLLQRIREELKDGIPPANVLKQHAEALRDEIANGDVELVCALSDSLRKPPRRSITDWIRRAWLPLALWQDESEQEKQRRIGRAETLLRATGLDLLPLPKAKASNPYPLSKIVGTVASQIKGHHRGGKNRQKLNNSQL